MVQALANPLQAKAGLVVVYASLLYFLLLQVAEFE
jgi:hypothetical protein